MCLRLKGQLVCRERRGKAFLRNSILTTPLLWFTISHVINAGVELKFSLTHLPSVSPVCFSFALRGTEDVRPQ
jgi:hypothetical protein